MSLRLKTYCQICALLATVASPISVLATENKIDEAICYAKGLSDQLRCGQVRVPENYANPAGKQISIHYVVVPAIKNSAPNKAFLALAGGPGQAAIEHAAGFVKTFSSIRQNQDILLIDQRGTGQSSPLHCDMPTGDAALSFDDSQMAPTQDIITCLDKFTEQDVKQYGSETAVKDLEQVRKALNYQELDIYGISYGTRMAQLYVRDYPGSVATITLDGVVPMNQSVMFIGEAIDRAVEILMQDCAKDKACQNRFPNLRQDYQALMTKLEAQPITEQVASPASAEMTTLKLTHTKFASAIRFALYAPQTRAIVPFAIEQAARGNYRPLLTFLNVESFGIAMGMHNAVVCGEDYPRLTEEDKTRLSRTLFGREMIKVGPACDYMAMPEVSEQFSNPVATDKPVLLLSGFIDPATPPEWGEMAMTNMPNALHLVSPFAGHGLAQQTCARTIIADFIEQGSLSKLDADCLNFDISRSFYLNANTVETLDKNTIKSVVNEEK